MIPIFLAWELFPVVVAISFKFLNTSMTVKALVVDSIWANTSTTALYGIGFPETNLVESFTDGLSVSNLAKFISSALSSSTSSGSMASYSSSESDLTADGFSDSSVPELEAAVMGFLIGDVDLELAFLGEVGGVTEADLFFGEEEGEDLVFLTLTGCEISSSSSSSMIALFLFS
ncbi:hypothetical protein WICPIJ_007453 [Wickerhamomyces pijperi]|uniref:Uncharacterized protein n=1 Tax=Wickerhamomyces pijperi TaxID=599730 RepID=A0A9P8Q2E2_WICPI|nr:hypothetical protein WICPIJ_007453 [Wickerhamomyces pijperi]